MINHDQALEAVRSLNSSFENDPLPEDALDADRQFAEIVRRISHRPAVRSPFAQRAYRPWQIVAAAFAIVLVAFGLLAMLRLNNNSVPPATPPTPTTLASTTVLPTLRGDGTMTVMLTPTGATSLSVYEGQRRFEDGTVEYRYGGFVVDLLEEITSRIGLELELLAVQDDPWAGFTTVASTNVDLFAGAGLWMLSDGRVGGYEYPAGPYQYTDPWLNTQLLVFALPSVQPDLLSLDDLDETTPVAVLPGPGEQWARANLEPLGIPIIVVDDSIYAMLLEPDSGPPLAAAAVVEDAWHEVDDMRGQILHRPTETEQQWTFLIDPNNPGLLAAYNTALAEMVADGTYQTLYNQYFSWPEGSIAPQEVVEP